MKVSGFQFSLTTVLAVVAALWVGSHFGPERHHVFTETVVKQVPNAVMRGLLREMQINHTGVVAALEGRRQVDPVVVVQTDTVVVPPDTVLVAARMTAAGDVEFGRLIRSDSAAHLFAPSIAIRRLGNCDEGWSWAAGAFVCDAARLGHLYAYAEMAATWRGEYGGHGRIGLWWQPSYRSRWRADLGFTTDGTLALAIRRGVKLF